jgi:hypothetical protein
VKKILHGSFTGYPSRCDYRQVHEIVAIPDELKEKQRMIGTELGAGSSVR